MTWGLLNHNVKILPASYSPPDDGSEINPEEVLVGDEALASTIWDGIIGSDGNGRLMALLSEGGTFYYSSDHGATWSEKGASPWAGTTDRLICDPSSGAWFFINYGTSNADVWRSTDDGQNWSTVSDPVGQYSDSFIAIDQDGAILMVAARPAVVYRYGDAGGSLSPSSNSSSFASGHNVDGIAVASDKAVFVKHWDGGAMEYTELGYDLSSPTTYNNGIDQPSRWDAAPFVAGPDNALSWRGQSGSEVTFYFIEPSSTTPIPQWTYDFGFDVDGVRVRHNGVYWLMVGFSNSDRTKAYAASSESGADGAWTGVVTINLSAERKADNYAGPMDIEYAGNGWWVIAYYDGSSFLHVERFKYDGYAGGVFDPGDTALLREIRKQAPNIFLKLDDTGSPSSVTDIGRKGYANATSGTITFEQSGLIDDGGTAALFGGGAITVSVEATSATWTVDKSKQPILNGMANDGGQVYEGSRVGSLVATAKLGTPQYVSEAQYLQLIGLSSGLGGADDHVHVFVLSHDDTASSRTLLEYGDAWSVTLDADDKVSFTDGTDTLTSSNAIAADTATLLIVSIEKQGGKVNLYLDDGHEGYGTFTIESPESLTLALGGTGVTIDYYAAIPYGNADIAAIQEAWGSTPTAPNATGATVGDAKLIVRADSAASLVNVWHPDLEEWRDVYRIENYGSSDREVEWWQEGGSGIVDLTDGKFGGGCLSVPARPATGSYLPHKEPYWSGFHQLGVGTQDFTLAAWVKPGGNQAYVVSSQPYWRSGGIYHRYAGFTLTLVGDASGASLKLQVGHALNDALAGNGDSDALVLNFLGYPTFTPGSFNFVTLCRKNLKWYATVNGRLESSRSLQGNLNAPVVMEPQYRAMHIGKYLKRYNGGADLASHCYAAKFDDVVFVLGEALYTQEFTPPTSRFEA